MLLGASPVASSRALSRAAIPQVETPLGILQETTERTEIQRDQTLCSLRFLLLISARRHYLLEPHLESAVSCPPQRRETKDLGIFLVGAARVLLVRAASARAGSRETTSPRPAEKAAAARTLLASKACAREKKAATNRSDKSAAFFIYSTCCAGGPRSPEEINHDPQREGKRARSNFLSPAPGFF